MADFTRTARAKVCKSCGRPLKDNVAVGGKIKNGVCRHPVCPRFGK